MDLSSGLLLKNLILNGHRKDYWVPFHPGVNIIYGDADTGKSSILRLVYYLLGGKQIKLDKEITSSVKCAVLEISINGNPYCISRDIFNSGRDVDVYSCAYSDISRSFPDKYKSSVSQSDEENKSLSEFLIEALGFPAVMLKQAPSKDSSDVARLSFLDLFKFMYLDQDDVGSTKMLNIGNPVVEVKNREVFKYIFNVLDSGISELEADIANKSKEKTDLSNQYSVISRFLNDTDFKSLDDLDRDLNNVDEARKGLEKLLLDLNSRITSDNQLYDSLSDALNTINLKITENEQAKNEALRNIDRFARLSNDYENDINKIDAGLSAKQVVGAEIEETTSCPVCETVVEISEISKKFDMSSETRLKSEKTSIKRRLKDLKGLIDENINSLDAANSTLDELYAERNKARRMIDEELAKSVSPYLAERDAIVEELAQLDERREKLVHFLRVRNKQELVADQASRLEATIIKLKKSLSELKDNAPSLEEVLKDLSTDIDKFIRKVKINNHVGVGIDGKTFLPRVRDTEYRSINSGGLRTVASIGYLATILRQKLRKETNIPGLLMIDTVGKFLGKTPEDSEGSFEGDSSDVEGVADPEKYKNLFDALIDIAEEFDAEGKLCQIILVDNDIPPSVAYENVGFEVAHYRSNGVNDLPVGLIDDWKN
ncbi:AAA family ATPase [Marinobacter oulmenensis]|uniref:Uncharacterized Zn finger protein (UPF0148 family) n=1 Tax=Marinobacter oulmenensis TaxID=643747 RepID=A0A840ULD2_9GAMM|nr:uncharacterized Zn finger protein (UPF0148 family) [Marinobacter oulmenensis]